MTLRFDPAGVSARPVQLDLPLAMPLATPLSMPGAPGLKSRAAGAVAAQAIPQDTRGIPFGTASAPDTWPAVIPVGTCR